MFCYLKKDTKNEIVAAEGWFPGSDVNSDHLPGTEL